MYVRVQIQQGIQRSAFAVPQQAVQRDPGGQANVLVVNADNKVEQRRITVGRAVGDRFVVTNGLNAGDRVVAEGFQKTAPGATVKPEPWTATPAQAGTAAPAKPSSEQASATKAEPAAKQ
jgi:membrane fusion protein (multidrug efflux system)